MRPLRSMAMRRHRRAQAGLTLVELMISIALGLLIMAAMGYLYVNNRQTFRTQESVARIQENGRYALEVMAQNLRMAGYVGCGNLSDADLTLQVLAGNAPDFDEDTVLQGFDNAWGVDRNLDGAVNASDKPDNLVPDTDSVVVFKAANEGYFLNAGMAGTASDITLHGADHDYKAADIAIIADCTHVDLFRVSQDSAEAGGVTTLKHAGGPGNTCTDTTPDPDKTYNPCNGSAGLGKAYGSDAMVMPLDASVYYLGTNPSGNTSLYRLPWSGGGWGSAEELVENVEAMQITYGVDADGDGDVDPPYVKAGGVTAWNEVLAVRVSLLLRSPENNVATQAQTYVWDSDNDGQMDDSVTATDRRLRYVFTSTVALRNRVQ